jgi:ubiquinone/menaquinone biosynthesis C-methylase UbiE
MSVQNPFSKPEPWSVVSKGYEETTMDYLSQYAQDALSTVDLNNQATVLDVACGPGTVSRLIHSKVAKIDCLDFSEEMISIVDDYIKTGELSNISTTIGDGQNLPFSDNSYDLATSMFGLMFFPDRLKGFSELYRCLKPGGQTIVTSWAPVDQSPAMQLMFGAIRAAKPDLPKPDTVIANLEKKEVFENELQQAGFSDIVVRPITHFLVSESVNDIWDFMVKGSAPIAMMKKNHTPEDWLTIEEKAKTYINDAITDFPVTLGSDAWVGCGTK